MVFPQFRATRILFLMAANPYRTHLPLSCRFLAARFMETL